MYCVRKRIFMRLMYIYQEKWNKYISWAPLALMAMKAFLVRSSRLELKRSLNLYASHIIGECAR